MSFFKNYSELGHQSKQKPIVLDPEKLGVTLVLSDVHLPYTNHKAFKAALKHAKKEGVQSIILNGDFLDFHRVSRYAHSADSASMAEEIEYGNAALDEIQKRFPDATIIYKMGNHEDRLINYINAFAPNIAGLGTTVPELLRMEERGIIFTGRRLTTFGDLVIAHGDEVRGIGGIDPARKASLKFPGWNVLVGHTHRGESRYFCDATGKETHTHVVGHLGEVAPDYHPHNNWRLGWAIIEQVDGKVLVDNMVYENGRKINVSTMQR